MEIEQYLIDNWDTDIREEKGLKFAVINLGISDDYTVLKMERDLIWNDVKNKFPLQSKYVCGSNYDPLDDNSIMFQLTGELSKKMKLKLEIEEWECPFPGVDLLITDNEVYWITKDQSLLKVTSIPYFETSTRILIGDLSIITMTNCEGIEIKGSFINNADLWLPLTHFDFIVAIASSE